MACLAWAYYVTKAEQYLPRLVAVAKGGRAGERGVLVTHVMRLVIVPIVSDMWRYMRRQWAARASETNEKRAHCLLFYATAITRYLSVVYDACSTRSDPTRVKVKCGQQVE